MPLGYYWEVINFFGSCNNKRSSYFHLKPDWRLFTSVVNLIFDEKWALFAHGVVFLFSYYIFTRFKFDFISKMNLQLKCNSLDLMQAGNFSGKGQPPWRPK